MDRRLYRPREVAEMLALSRGEVYALIAQGRIRAVRIAKSVRITAEELDRLSTTGIVRSEVAE